MFRREEKQGIGDFFCYNTSVERFDNFAVCVRKTYLSMYCQGAIKSFKLSKKFNFVVWLFYGCGLYMGSYGILQVSVFKGCLVKRLYEMNIILTLFLFRQ